MNTTARQPGRAYRFNEASDASFLAPVPAVYTKAVDSRKLSVTAILTFPCADLAGDEVKADGGDWSQHKAFPWVGLEHHRYFANDRNRSGLLGQPGVGSEPVVVAWTRDSLSEPGGEYRVELKSFKLDGETHTLPVGTSFFDPNDRLSAQTFAMVESDALPGVSMEFVPKARRQRLAQSPLERRPAYHFDRWDALGFVHCAIPVNPGALVCKSVSAACDQLTRALTDKRVGREPMHEILFKSLSRYLPAVNRSTVRVENKAMPLPTDDAPPETAYDDALPTEPADDAPPLNGVQALLNHVQAGMDLYAGLEADIQSSDSPELRKLTAKVIAQGKKQLAKVKAAADKHDAKLSGKEMPEEDDDEEPEDDDDADDSELDDDEAEALETDDEGVLKAVRQPYRPKLEVVHKAMVRPISLAEVRKAAPVNAKSGNAVIAKASEPEAGDSAEDLAELAREKARLAKALKRSGVQ